MRTVNNSDPNRRDESGISDGLDLEFLICRGKNKPIKPIKTCSSPDI